VDADLRRHDGKSDRRIAILTPMGSRPAIPPLFEQAKRMDADLRQRDGAPRPISRSQGPLSMTARERDLGKTGFSGPAAPKSSCGTT
jgi:hypothetical protein